MDFSTDSGFASYTAAFASTRARFIALLLQFGIPFTITALVIIAAAAVGVVHGRLDVGFAKLLPASLQKPVALSWAAAAFYLISLASAILLLIWGFSTAINVGPATLGVGILVLIPAALLAAAGIYALRQRSWRAVAYGLHADTGGESNTWERISSGLRWLGGVVTLGAQPATVCLVLALTLFTAYEFAVIFVSPTYSYLAVTWLFVTFNQLAVSAALHAAVSADAALQPRALIAAALQWRAWRETVASAPPASGAAGAIATAPFVSTGPSTADSSGASVSLLQAFLVAQPGLHVLPKGALTDADTLHEQGSLAAAAGATGSVPRDLQLARSADTATPWWACGSVVAARFCPGSRRRGAGWTRQGRAAGVWYVLSLLILVAYMIVNTSLAGSGAGSARNLCFPTVATILLLDLLAGCLWASGILQTPGLLLLMLTGARIALIAYGTQYWLLGQCTVYAIVGLYLAHTAAEQLFSRQGASPLQALRQRLRSLTRARAIAAAATSGEPSSATRSAGVWTHIKAGLLTPAGMLVVQTVLFTVLIVVLASAMSQPGSTLPNPLVPTLGGGAPQYAFGIGALCLVALLLCGEVLWAHYRANALSLSRGGWAFAGVTWAVAAACGAGLYGVTGSWVLLYSGVFVPPALIALCAMYGQWVRDDFRFALPGGLPLRVMWAAVRRATAPVFARCSRASATDDGAPAVAESAAAGTGTGGATDKAAGASSSRPTTPENAPTSGGSATGATPSAVRVRPSGADVEAGEPPSADAEAGETDLPTPDIPGATPAQLRNTAMAIGAVTVLLSLIAFGGCMSSTDTPPFLGWIISGGITVVLFTLAPLVQYFQTLEFEAFQPVSLAIALGFHAAIHGYLFGRFPAATAGAKVTVAIAFSFCVYPFLVLLLTALYKWRDDKWRLSRFVVVCAAVSQTIVLGFLIAAIVVYKSEIVIPAALTGAYLALTFAVAVLAIWVRNGFFLPRLWTRIVAGAIGFVVLGGVAMCLWELFANSSGTRAVLWLSVAYWTVVVTLGVLGVTDIYWAGGFRGGLAASAAPGGLALLGGSSAVLDDDASDGTITVVDSLTGAEVQLELALGADAAPAAGTAARILGAAAFGARMSVGVPLVPGAPSDAGAQLYYGPLLFPALAFDPARSSGAGGLRSAHRGPALLLTSLALAAAWGLAAMVFVTPPWAGVLVTNVVKIVAAVYVLDGVRRSEALLTDALRRVTEAAVRQANTEAAAAAVAAASAASAGAGAASSSKPPAAALPLADTAAGQLVVRLLAALPPLARADLQAAAEANSVFPPDSGAPGANAAARTGAGAAKIVPIVVQSAQRRTDGADGPIDSGDVEGGAANASASSVVPAVSRAPIASGEGAASSTSSFSPLPWLPADALALAIARSLLLEAVCGELEGAVRTVRAGKGAGLEGALGEGNAGLAPAAPPERRAGKSAGAPRAAVAASSDESATSDAAGAGASAAEDAPREHAAVVVEASGAEDGAAETTGATAASSAAPVTKQAPPPRGAGRGAVKAATAGTGPAKPPLPAQALAYGVLFRERALLQRAEAVSVLAAGYLQTRWSARQRWAPCLRKRAEGAAPASAPPSALLAAALEGSANPDAAAFDALLADGRRADAFARADDIAAALAALPTRPAAAAAAPGDATAVAVAGGADAGEEAGEASTGAWEDVAALLQHVGQMDDAARAATDEAALLTTFMRHGLFRAGCAAASGELAAWSGFLNWCSQPDVLPLLTTLGLPDVRHYHSILVDGADPAALQARVAAEARAAGTAAGASAGAAAGATPAPTPATPLLYRLPTRGALLSRASLLSFWRREIGLQTGTRLGQGLAAAHSAFLQAAKAAAAVTARRRAQDEAAERAREALDRQRDAEERQREAAERAAAEREAAEAAAAVERAAAEARAAEEARVAAAARAAAEAAEAAERMRREQAAAAAAAAEAERQRVAQAAREAEEARLRHEAEAQAAMEALQARAAAAAQEAETQRQRAAAAAEVARKSAEEAAAREAALRKQHEEELAAAVAAAKAAADAEAAAALRAQQEALQQQERERAAAEAKARADAAQAAAAERERLQAENAAMQRRIADLKAQQEREAAERQAAAAAAAAQASAAAQAQAEAQRRAEAERQAAADRAAAAAKAKADAEAAAAASAQRAREEAAAAAARAAAAAAAQERDRAAARQKAEAEAAAAALRAKIAADQEAKRRADAEAAAAAQRQRDAEAAHAAQQRAAEQAAAADKAAAQQRAADAAAAAAKAKAESDAAAAAAAAASATVTASANTDAHAAALLDKVAKLAEQAKAAGKPYTDAAFSGAKAAGDAVILKDAGPWMRMKSFHPAPAVIEDGLDPSDVAQGSVGDCYLLSALSVLAGHDASYIDGLLLTRSVSPEGVYATRWWKGGAWREVIIDDTFPTRKGAVWDGKDADTYLAGSPDPAKGRFATAFMATSRTRREFWVQLLEKSYAKLYGSVAAIGNGGLPHTVFTAAVPNSSGSMLSLEDAAVAAKARSGELWTTLMSYNTLGYLLGAGSPSGSDKDTDAMGIVQGHAFSILRLAEESDAKGSYQLLQLRNPWGKMADGSEWKGAFSDKDKERWTRRLRQLLNYNPDDGTHGEDGTFWMQWSDFCKHFSDLYICRIFKTVPEGGSWYKYTTRGCWKGKTAAGVLNGCAEAKNNPQYLLKLSKPCSVHISLAQVPGTFVSKKKPAAGAGAGADASASLAESDEVAIGFSLLRKQGMRAAYERSGDNVLEGTHSFTPEVAVDGTNMEPDAEPWTLHVSTYAPGQELSFIITVYADAPLEGLDGESLKLLPDTVPAK